MGGGLVTEGSWENTDAKLRGETRNSNKDSVWGEGDGEAKCIFRGFEIAGKEKSAESAAKTLGTQKCKAEIENNFKRFFNGEEEMGWR